MTKVIDLDTAGRGAFTGLRLLILGLVVMLFILFLNPIAVIPAGNVGVLDFFGSVSSRVLPSGVHLVVPFTRVIRMSVQTQELKEVAEVPSQEGLIMDLEVSLLYRLEPDKADDIYKTVGRNYVAVVVEPQIRSAIREITASYDAKALYSSERDKVSQEMMGFFAKLTRDRGIITEGV